MISLTLVYKTPYLISTAASPDGIAVDYISRLVFFTDTGNDVIVVMTIDGTSSKVIINTGVDEPRACIVDGQG
jgi:hypothetical protein